MISATLTANLLRTDRIKIGDFTRAAFADYPHLPLSVPTKTYAGDFALQARFA
jgi:hypothetical protein